MRIGLVVDGQSEIEAIALLKPQLEQSTGHTLIGPVLAVIHPKARPPVTARATEERIAVLQSKVVGRIIMLIDREDSSECCGQLADALVREIQPNVSVPVLVVIKDRMFENWLIADTEALRSMPGRFNITDAVVGSIAPNKADQVDAINILRSAAIRRSYQKVRDSRQILERADLLRMAANSRSFRRFLRCLDHPAYREQSRLPR